MASFIIILIVIVGILLGLVILVQNPKGGGLASGFTGASNIGGVQKTADFLEKSTWYLTAALFVLCLAAAKFKPGSGAAGSGDALGDDATEQMIDPGATEGAPVLEEGGASEGGASDGTPQSLPTPGQ